MNLFHGIVEREPLPSTPIDLDVQIAAGDDELPGVDYSQYASVELPAIGAIVYYDDGAETAWLYGLSTDCSGTRWMLWERGSYAEAGQDDVEEFDTIVVACCACDGIAAEAAALYLLRARWSAVVVEDEDLRSPDQIEWLGIIEEGDLYGIVDEVWPDDEP
jgi:hypothetical protein